MQLKNQCGNNPNLDHVAAAPTGPSECQSVKTAAVETEVWTGFEVLHTNGIGHTVQLFAQLTSAIQVRHTQHSCVLNRRCLF